MFTIVRRHLYLVMAVLVFTAVATPVEAQRYLVLQTPVDPALKVYAADTWESFEAMAFPSGLPTDNISAEGVRAGYTSPTNIGNYIWSTLAARDLRLITPGEARERIGQTLETLATMERHEYSGQFYNWYDPDTGAKLTAWPPTGDPIYPFLSSVDNGWLAAALIMVSNAIPQLRDAAEAILAGMDFGFYYDPAAGLLRGGFWVEPPPGCSIQGNYSGNGPDVFYTCHHYGSFNTEPRIASYIAIAFDQVPETHYFKGWRTFPGTCDWGWHEMQPQGEWHTYLGVDVFEGHYTYHDMNIVPSWGGSMFEALIVPLLVPEEEWGPQSWGINHPLYVQAQIEHGLDEAQYGYWGFSPATNPSGGYREYGVDAIGLNPDGYASNNDNTLVDYGFGECRPPQPLPPPEAYTDGVVTPHASFLALEFAPEAALENLANLRSDFDVYGDYGFYDSVNVDTGEVSRYYLALDQGMIMAALGNFLTNDRLQAYFIQGEVEEAMEPLMAIEVFTAGPGD
ncbi:MAG: DUF3131 domain-containing protein [Chloroflexi bacterium]|nr:DUF3131 domain-containing protein [Chloroflexota bacterium]MCI0574983.1 DUF3131 domain-containing protein [Chloroflexota bacterium]MCI0648447.1 DUF3131 domain-containing protein [Chloroflexota bacterium]MCI0727585.1 DUF3131 domain-containing protein [Chloroflexota bacterium]